MKYLNALLMILAIWGGVQALRAGSQEARLRTELRQLQTKLGRMPIEDPTQVAIVALQTGDPLHFAWRIHLPEGYQHEWRCRTSSGHSSLASMHTENSAGQPLVRVRFRQLRGQWYMWSKVPHGSSVRSVDPALAEVLEAPEKRRVLQIAREGAEVFSPDQIITLFELSSALSDAREQSAEPPLVRFQLGSAKAWQQADSAAGESDAAQPPPKNGPTP